MNKKNPTTPSLPSPMTPRAPLEISLGAFTSAKDSPEEKGELGLPPEERVGIAFLGLGIITINQAIPATMQSKRAKIAGLISGSLDQAQRIGHSFGLKKDAIFDYKNLEKIASNQEIKGVYIGTPNSTHREFVTRVAHCGKHILCEKPMAPHLADCEAMIDVCKKSGVKLMIAYRQQYEPYNTVIRQIVQEKIFGKVKTYEAHFGQNMGDPSQWRLKKNLSGGGPLPDMGIYPLNACRFHTGQEPIEVMGWIQQNPDDPRFKEVEEGVVWQMRFRDGLIAHCSTSYGVHQGGQFRYFAENASFGMSPAFGYQGTEFQFAAPGGDFQQFAKPYLPEKNQFVLQFEHFCQAILEDKKIQSPGEEGLKDVKIIEAIYESARQNKPVMLT